MLCISTAQVMPNAGFLLPGLSILISANTRQLTANGVFLFYALNTVYKTESVCFCVCLSVSLFLMHGHSFE